jgi:hypothetical protein
MNERRYVVLHHTGWGEDHYDLLLEVSPDGPLESWRFSEWPPTERTLIGINAPHRRLYLDYEGEVSHGRGHVSRAASGTYTELRENQNRLLVCAPGRLRILLPDSSRS